VPGGRSEPRAGSLGRDTGVLAAGTLLSRLTGFVRVVLVAAVLGVNGLGDAYNFANGVPNTVYDLLLGGVLAATLIPVFVDELRREDAGDGDGGIQAVLGTIAVALVGLSVALYLLAPVVVRFYLLLTPASRVSADERAVGTSLLRLFAPQVFFLGAIVVSTALLNARRRFAAAAVSPVINNLVAIAALLLTAVVARDRSLGVFRHDTNGLLVLGVGTTLGYVAQFLLQLPAMVRAGLPLGLRWSPGHPAVRRVVGLSAWLFGVVITNQVSYNLIVVLAEAHARRGDFTVYQTAYQFFQLPYAIFAVSIASAIMPDLAERWSDRDHVAFLRRVILGVRSTFALLLPAAVGFALVAQPAISLAVRHGLVGASGADRIAATVVAFAFGLPGFSVFLPLVRALQAMKDTRTMFTVYALENGLTVVLAVPLYHLLGVPGLAVAWSAPYTVASIAVAVFLRRRVGPLGGVYTGRSLWRSGLATAVMAGVVTVASRLLPAGQGDPHLLLRVVVEVGAGAGAYLVIARAVGVAELDLVLGPLGRLLRRRSGRRVG
jgi:putative peptidoglycan lipid II flippase